MKRPSRLQRLAAFVAGPDWQADPPQAQQHAVAEATVPEVNRLRDERPLALAHKSPVSSPPVVSPVGPVRGSAEDTASSALLRTPTNVAAVADDFFDGIIQRVEGDR